MAIWAIFAAMTGVAVMAVLWPLSRPARARSNPEADTRFYRDQIEEIDRDVRRGLIAAPEAEAAKAEAGRRLLRAEALRGTRGGDAFGEPALRRRRAASAIAISMIPLVAIATYGGVGAPHIPSAPLAARLGPGESGNDIAALVERVERHLFVHPEDGRGWEVLAPIYMRLGRVDAAVRASGASLRLLGRTTERLELHGEALVAQQEGLVSKEARALFDEAVSRDPHTAKSRYYLAQAAEQEGDRAAAKRQYDELIARAPADASWLPFVRERLALLSPGVPVQNVATPPEADQDAAIRGMVDGLAKRLEERGGTIEEWSRLVRSYVVLGEQAKAKETLDKARRRVEVGQIASLDQTARELGLEAEGNRK